MARQRTTSQIRQSPKLPPDIRRRQLLDAAERLFLKRGYRATTVEEIARGAGLTKGAVYHHFKNKEDILYEMVKYTAEQFIRGLAELPAGRMAPVDFLKALQRIGSDPKMPRIRSDVEIRIQAMKIARIRALVRRMIERGIAVFSERIDPRYARTTAERRQLAIFTYCLWDGLSLRRLADPTFVNLKRQTNLFASLFERHGSVGKRKRS